MSELIKISDEFKSAVKFIFQIISPVIGIVLYHEHKSASQSEQISLHELRITNLENIINPKMKFEPFSNNNSPISDSNSSSIKHILGYYDERKRLNTPIWYNIKS